MGDDEKKLFVGKLPADITEEEIRIVFNTYGTVNEVHIMEGGRTRPGQDTQRCAFVTYDTPQAASAAIQVLNNVYKFRDAAPEPIHVSVARPRGPKGGKGDGYGGYGGFGGCDGYGGGDWGKGGYGGDGYGGCYGKGGYGGCGGCGGGYGGCGGYGGGYQDFDGGKGGGKKGAKSDTKLYVGNLPADISREALEMVFGTYGPIEDIHIMTGRSKSGQACAFIRYSSPAEAKSAIAAMQSGYEIRPGEGNIIVKYADDNQRTGKGCGGGGGGGGMGMGGGFGGDRFRPY